MGLDKRVVMEEYRIVFQYLPLDECWCCEVSYGISFYRAIEETKEKAVIEACKKLSELVLN